MEKFALLTGMGSNSLARAIASALLHSGYSVVAATEGDFEAGSDARNAFESSDPKHSDIIYESADFSSGDGIDDLVRRASIRDYDVLVNCTTVLALSGDQLRNEGFDFSYDEFNRVLQTSVSSVAALCFGLATRIRAGGSIINVTSSAGKEGGFATISYNASKAAIDNLTKSLANVLGPSRGIHVNGLAPGWIPPSADAASGGIIALANALTPSLEIGQAEDAAKAALYLINSKFHNGTILPLDGGISSSYLPYMLESLELNGEPVKASIDSIAALAADAKSRFRPRS
ncbi:MAG: SDR family oxidoreductase [Microlunatus sp.]